MSLDPLKTSGVLLMAPGGYGKSWWLQQWQATFKLKLLSDQPFAFSAPFFETLNQQCLSQGLPLLQAGQTRQWLAQLELSQPLGLFIDHWEQLEPLSEIQAFVAEVLQYAPSQLKLFVASRVYPRLPLTHWVTNGGQLWDRKQLCWPMPQAQAYWQAHDVHWEKQDQDFWQTASGWPLGLCLWLKKRCGSLSEASFQLLLHDAIQQVFPPFLTKPAEGFKPELQLHLQRWLSLPQDWPPLFYQHYHKQLQLSPAYWLSQATQRGQTPAQTSALLERALQVSTEHDPLRLRMLTRLAHQAALRGDSRALEQALQLGEAAFEDSLDADRAVWLYMQANRLRQKCHYPEALALLERLAQLKGSHATIVNFQTRAIILKGLIAYQQGGYALTAEYYQQALYLAQADQNHAMQIELEVMLGFLHVLTGEAEQSLADDLAEQVQALPLENQPLIWLNLTFYQLLGEKVDLQQGQSWLKKVRETSEALQWQSLTPLIADIEARLWRFFKDYGRAERLHQQALALLEPQTFDWMFASLNYALTLSRLQRSQEAQQLLQTVSQQAEATESWGVLREAQSALNAFQEAQGEQPEPLARPTPVISGVRPVNIEKRLEIQTFGAFQVRLGQELIERWPRKRARHLLLNLLLHPHGLHRESLADWLTQSEDLEQALRSLDVHIHALRKVLEPERKGKQASLYIHFQDACYRFNWDCLYLWDSEIFDRAYQAWLKAKPAAEAETFVEQMLSVFKGAFLPELDFADDWHAQRESYTRKATDMLQWSIEQHWQAERWEQAEIRAEQLFLCDPVSEPGFSWLMKLAAQKQEPARLARMGERMEQVFSKETGLGPPSALHEQYLQLMRQQSS